MKEKAKPVQSVDQEEQENENRTEIQLKEGEDKEASTKDTQHTRTVEKKDSVKADSSSVTGSGSRKKEEVKIMNEQVAKALAKQEAKREKKLLRKKAWDELHYKKPKDGEEDPTPE